VAEYDRVNSFKEIPKETRIRVWTKANEAASNTEHDNSTNVWTLVQKLAAIIKSDDCDALSYMDKALSFDEISGDDSYDFCVKQMEYRKWLSEFEEAVK